MGGAPSNIEVHILSRSCHNIRAVSFKNLSEHRQLG